MDYTVHGILQDRILEWVLRLLLLPETPGQASVGRRVRGGFFWGTGGRAQYLC